MQFICSVKWSEDIVINALATELYFSNCQLSAFEQYEVAHCLSELKCLLQLHILNSDLHLLAVLNIFNVLKDKKMEVSMCINIDGDGLYNILTEKRFLCNSHEISLVIVMKNLVWGLNMTKRQFSLNMANTIDESEQYENIINVFYNRVILNKLFIFQNHHLAVLYFTTAKQRAMCVSQFNIVFS